MGGRGGGVDPPVISQCGAPTVMHRWSALSDTGSTIRHEMETSGAHICRVAQSSHSKRGGKKSKKAWAQRVPDTCRNMQMYKACTPLLKRQKNPSPMRNHVLTFSTCNVLPSVRSNLQTPNVANTRACCHRRFTHLTMSPWSPLWSVLRLRPWKSFSLLLIDAFDTRAH